jgi:hypothetical protein
MSQQPDWIKEHCKSIKRLATQDPITLEELTLIWKYADLIDKARASETETLTFPEAEEQAEAMVA